MPLDPGARRLLRMLAATSPGAGAPRTASERRRDLEGLAELADEPPADVLEVRDLSLPGPAGPLPARLYAPAGEANAGGLVFFHGGGWVAGGLRTHDGFCRRLAAGSGARLLAVDYRLAPEHPFPAAVEDALAATCWAAAQAQALGIDPDRLGVAGDSAGAGLAAGVAQSRQAPPLALQLLICPILDVANQSASRRALAEGYFLDARTFARDLDDYRGAHADLYDPRLSPLLASDLAGAPPALVHTAEYDPFRDEGEAYARRLGAAGVDVRLSRWPGMIHYFYALPRAIPDSVRILSEIGAEVAEALG